MTHQTEIVAYKKLSNGQFAFCVRCCGAADTDSWHTMDALVAADNKKRNGSLDEHRARVAMQHEHSLKAGLAATEIVGSLKIHEGADDKGSNRRRHSENP